MKFPNDPTDGMIFEATPGLFYIYSSKNNEWIRCDGYDRFELATLTSDGLMSKDDYAKLQDLIIPPPSTILTSDDCGYIFSNGSFGFGSRQNHLFIENSLDLVNKVDGVTKTEKKQWQIHENTFGYNFKVNLEQLVDELESRGNIRYLKSQGPQGIKGDPGDPGRDRLETGPQGDDGDDGANAQFDGTIIEGGGALPLNSDNRAIVDVYADKVSKDENYLVFTRAKLGNLDSCPDEVVPRNFRSPWVLVIDDDASKASYNKEYIVDDCRIACAPCVALRYLYIDPILDKIAEKFRKKVDDLKSAKEKLVEQWLNVMIDTFIQTRNAICCALENVESAKRNQDERRYIETQRTQAAQANFQLVVDGIEDREVFNMNDPSCASGGGKVEVSSNECLDCSLEITLDPVLNSGGRDYAVEGNLGRGDYIVEIEDCCVNYGHNSWSGAVVLEYGGANGFVQSRPPSLGSYQTNQHARNSFLGLKWSIAHSGGTIRAWIPDNTSSDNSGQLVLCIKPAKCYEIDSTPINNPSLAQCDMQVSQVRWYERGWIIGECCGAHVNYQGVEFIVVKRSIGIDKECGGGESLVTPCIAKFIDNVGHPAIAFPTSNGNEFLGVPDSGVQSFTYNEGMSKSIVSQINNGDVIKTIGDPADNISVVLFPVV